MAINYIEVPFTIETTVEVEDKSKVARHATIPAEKAEMTVAIRSGGKGSLTIYTKRDGSATTGKAETDTKGKLAYWLQEGSYTLTFSGGVQEITPVSIDWDAVGGSGPEYVGESAKVLATNIETEAVETAKIKNEAITAAKIAPNAVETTKIKEGAVTAARLAFEAVETVKIKGEAVTEAKIATGAVAESKLASESVSEAKIKAKAVSEGKLAVAVTERLVPTGGTTAQVLTKKSNTNYDLIWTTVAGGGGGGSPTGPAGGDLEAEYPNPIIAPEKVTTAKIKNEAVTAGKIGPEAVETAKLKNEAVTAAKLGTNAVETSKVKNEAITEPLLAAKAVTAAKLAENAVETIHLKVEAITAGKIASEAVETGKIKNLAVTTEKLAENSVTSIKIAPEAVETSDIKNEAVTEAKITAAMVTKLNEKSGTGKEGPEGKTGLNVVNVTAHAITPEEADSSSKVQTLMNEWSTKGGAIIFFPAVESKKIYFIREVKVPSNIWIAQEPGVKFQMAKPTESAGKTLIIWGNSSGSVNTENNGAIGKLTLDLSNMPVGSSVNAKCANFLGVTGAYFPWIEVVGSGGSLGSPGGTKQGLLFMNPANNNETTKLYPTDVFIGILSARNCNGTGSGATQLTGLRNCHIGKLYNNGGIALRIECDAVSEAGGTEESKRGGVEGLRVDEIVAEEGEAGFSINPHWNYVRKVRLGHVYTRACGGWGIIIPGTKNINANGYVSVDSGECDGSGTIGHPSEFGTVDGLFCFKGGGLQENLKEPFHIGSLYVHNVANSGVWAFNGLHIDELTIENVGEHGISGNSREMAFQAKSRASINKLRVVNPNDVALISGFIEKWEIGTIEAIDNRGGSAKMKHGIEASGSTKIRLKAPGLIEGNVEGRIAGAGETTAPKYEAGNA